MKKQLASLITLAIVFTFTAGCGKATPEPESVNTGTTAASEATSETETTAPADDYSNLRTVLLITGSDFQEPATSYSRYDYAKNGDYTEQIKILNTIIGNIQDSLGAADYFIAGGDYNFDETTYSVDRTNFGIEQVRNTVKNKCGADVGITVVQGNHDAAGSDYDPTGPADTEDFGLFVIAHEDYRSYPLDKSKWKDPEKSEAKAQEVADKLDAYLAEKVKKEYDKPVFIAAHVPIHFNVRTATKADAIYGDVIYKVLYKYGNDLNIIFLYGHNHAWGDDDYLGAASNFLTRGDNINIAKHGSQKEYTAEPLNFTYMNYGYTGYFWAKWVTKTSDFIIRDDADTALTMTAFQICGNQVTISRWDENGIHDLKSVGVASLGHRGTAEVCTPDPKVVKSPYVVTAPKNPYPPVSAK